MYTLRGFVVVLSLFAIAGCASGSGTSPADSSCMPNTMSAPGTPDDPCAGVDQTICPPTTHMAVTSCTSEGHWATADGANCECVPKGGTSTPNCGNGRIDTGEKCDTRAAIPAGTTCMSLGMGTKGMPKCSSSCQFDTSMCSTGTGGMGGM